MYGVRLAGYLAKSSRNDQDRNRAPFTSPIAGSGSSRERRKRTEPEKDGKLTPLGLDFKRSSVVSDVCGDRYCDLAAFACSCLDYKCPSTTSQLYFVRRRPHQTRVLLPIKIDQYCQSVSYCRFSRARDVWGNIRLFRRVAIH
jgi:hypothetical protein